MSKITTEGFKDTFCSHDTVCLSETKVGPGESLSIDGYTEKSICRKKTQKCHIFFWRSSYIHQRYNKERGDYHTEQ